MNFPNEFVCATYEKTRFEQHIPAPIFRKRFTLENEKARGNVLISGLGFYDLWVNGKKITKGLLAPYISNPDDIVYFDQYDLTPYLQQGENVVGVMLGTGFQNPISTVWDFNLARHNASPRFAFSFESDELSFSAKDFLSSESQIIFNNYRSGVHCDARLEQTGWQSPNFDDHAWKAVLVAETPRGDFRICEAEPIVERQRISAVSIRRGALISGDARADIAERFRDNIVPVPIDDQTGYIYDFGINTAGVFELKINGTAGQRIVLQFAERLKDEAVDPTNISFFYPEGYGQRDIYICKGDGQELYIPPFVYHGYRYVYVSGITEEQATEGLLTYIEAHSDLEVIADLKASDETVNRLWEITLRSDLSNFHYFPTDCPHREKNGWTGDASMSAEHMLFTLGAENSFKEWMRNVCKAQNDEGALPGIIPTTGWGFDWGNGPAWDSVAFTVPYFTYIYRGDKGIIEESAPTMLRYLNYIARKRDENGIIAIGLGDWCPVGRGADEYNVPLGFTDTVMVYDMCRKAALMFEAIGQDLNRSYALAFGEELRHSIREAYLDESTMCFSGNCQSAQAMGLYYGIFDSGERKLAFDQLLSIINRDGQSMNLGFLGGRVLFHVLSDFGHSDLAYHMICKEEYPSYGNLLERGATSLWEMFVPEGRLSGSENHHFWGDINHWFLRQLCGINVNPNRKNPNEICIHPHFVTELNSIRGSYKAVDGKVSVEWSRVNQQISLTVTADEGLDVSIELDSGYSFENSGLSYLEQLNDGTVTVNIVKG